ncbi:hypothetical protein AB0C81_15255 [Streptomyces roseoverticillatus]|uniref:hypothetical protein n=1 Tax=Streptomyces roseoverticillatus TaxID=66429 RepID=UPI0033D0DEF2
MNEQDEKTQQTAAVHAGYPAGRLARAFTTAATHEDPDTRRRAEERIRRWRDVMDGMAQGRLTAGSRTPVAGLPAWVTPEVVRGGFATGAASAGGPLLPHEAETARRAGTAADRAALFAHWLTDAGLAELNAMLDSGAYEVAVPEEAALLTVAWLVRSGDRLGALRLLETLRPFAGRLRFAPRPGAAPEPADAAVAHRLTVGEAAQSIGRRRPNRAVEAMREALTVWNPFFDDMLELWLETADSGRVLARTPDEDWIARAGAAPGSPQRRPGGGEPFGHLRCVNGSQPENVTVPSPSASVTMTCSPFFAALNCGNLPDFGSVATVHSPMGSSFAPLLTYTPGGMSSPTM